MQGLITGELGGCMDGRELHRIPRFKAKSTDAEGESARAPAKASVQQPVNMQGCPKKSQLLLI